MEVSYNGGTSIAGWLIRETPIKIWICAFHSLQPSIFLFILTPQKMPGRVSRRNYYSRSWGFNQQKLGIKQPIPGSWVQGKTMEHIVMLIFSMCSREIIRMSYEVFHSFPVYISQRFYTNRTGGCHSRCCIPFHQTVITCCNMLQYVAYIACHDMSWSCCHLP